MKSQWVWETIFAKCVSDRALLPRIQTELLQLNQKTKTQPKKGDKDLKRHFTKDKQHTAHEKMPDIISSLEKCRCGNAPNWKQAKCPSAEEHINNRACPHSGNYSSWRQDGLEVCVTLGWLSKQSWDKRGQTESTAHPSRVNLERLQQMRAKSQGRTHGSGCLEWGGLERQEVFSGADRYLGRCALPGHMCAHLCLFMLPFQTCCPLCCELTVLSWGFPPAPYKGYIGHWLKQKLSLFSWVGREKQYKNAKSKSSRKIH